MDVLNAKKGRKALQYLPQGVDSELISDDEYDLFKGNQADILDEKCIKGIVDRLIADSYQEKLKNNKVALKSNDFVFKMQWEKYSSVVGHDIKLENIDIEDDFKLESEIVKVTLSNIARPLELLKQNNVKIGRELDEKSELYVAPKKSYKVLPKLSKKHKTAKKKFKNPEDMWLGLQETVSKKDSFASYPKNKKKKRFGKRTREIIRKKKFSNNHN